MDYIYIYIYIYALRGELKAMGGQLILLAGRRGLSGIDRFYGNLAIIILHLKHCQITVNYCHTYSLLEEIRANIDNVVLYVIFSLIHNR
jgi:hypothetical protein